MLMVQRYIAEFVRWGRGFGLDMPSIEYQAILLISVAAPFWFGPDRSGERLWRRSALQNGKWHRPPWRPWL